MSSRFSKLNSILESCKSPEKRYKNVKFLIPEAWTINPLKGQDNIKDMVTSGELTKSLQVKPYEFISQAIEKLLEYNKKNSELIEKELSDINLKEGENVRAINSLARVLSMYDHDGDGIIGSPDKDITLNSQGVREMGTFIKNILVLPYIKSLGFNTVHLQPLTEIGQYGRKGNLGSPFAIRDPFSIDPNLADPLFKYSAEEQYEAFLEAAHALGLKVVQEVIPRTLSIDSKVLEENPHYGYWVKYDCTKRMPEYYHPDYEYNTNNGKQKFSERKDFENWFFGEYQGKIYGRQYGINDLIDVNKTDPEYASFFMETPDVVKREKNGKLVGFYYKKDKNGNKIKDKIDKTIKAEVLPAFCDTPFEIQPFWQDVTYLKLYEDKHGDLPLLRPLTYITAKFFKDVEPEIEIKYRNEPVWNMITGYFDKFKHMGVDGFVLDMGHALPEDLKKAIKSVLPNVWEENLAADFSFLAENQVIITGKVFAYGQPSYNNAGEMKYYEENPEETIKYHIRKIKNLFEEAAEFDEYKGKMFGFPDNYNTKRIGQSPATRILSEGPLKTGTNTPDFTKSPVDQEKARKISLLYDTLFRIVSEKSGSPFIVNPVFANEFVATSTINVGLNTHMNEANCFFDYMTEEEKEKNPLAEKLLLMSKPEKSSGEWTNEHHYIGEILKVNDAIKILKPLLKKNKHIEVVKTKNEEILFLSLSSYENEEKLAIVANLDLSNTHSVELPFLVNHYYLNRPDCSPEEGQNGRIELQSGGITVFTY